VWNWELFGEAFCEQFQRPWQSSTFASKLRKFCPGYKSARWLLFCTIKWQIRAARNKGLEYTTRDDDDDDENNAQEKDEVIRAQVSFINLEYFQQSSMCELTDVMNESS
jgi:hypothetical protein